MPDSSKNQFLKVNKGVLMTSWIEPVIVSLDRYFKEANLTAYVTSGERTSGDQLRIIRNYCAQFKIDVEFPEIKTCGVLDREPDNTFKWQKAWSRLLNKGIIVNPPLKAECLFDYFRDGVNKKGQIINQSPHYYGKAFDIGGGLDHDPTNELEVIKKALADKLPGLKGYLLERKQNCLHVDVF